MKTIDRVISIIEKNINYGEHIHKDFNLTNDLGVDSFDSLMIINAIEDEFSISFSGPELGNFNVVDDIANAIDTKLHQNVC
jgi:acyl carrier protein